MAAFAVVLVAFGLQAVAAAPANAIPGLTNVTVSSPLDSNLFKAVVAPCPVGMKVIGGGARLGFATGEVSITYMAPTAAETGYEARAYEDWDGFLGNWQLVVTAICAPGPAGYVVVTASSPMLSPPTANVTATCPAGRTVIGTGGAVHPGRGVVMLAGIVPTASAVTALGVEVAPGWGSSWNVQSWAICAFPINGFMIAVATGPTNSLSPKSLPSPCPAARFVHGVGFQLGGGTGEIFFNGSFPIPAGPTSTTVQTLAAEDQTGFGGNWAIRTYAVCIP